MAATHRLLCLILYLAACGIVHPQFHNRYHVCEEGHTVTVLCPHHDMPYAWREWIQRGNLLRTQTVIYHQDSGSAVNNTGAGLDMSLNLTDFSLTVRSLQAKDTGLIFCQVNTGGQDLSASTTLYVYNRWVNARYNTSVTLQCPVDTAGSIKRLWYVWPFSSNFLIYTHNASGIVKGPAARDDMFLDTDTFDLTIGNVTLLDYRFTCSVTAQQTTNFGIIFPAIYSVVLEAEERTSVMLPCDEVKERTTQSTWDYTRTWQRVNGDILYLQYLYNFVFFERRPAARADMSLNNDTFALTIGSAQLEDSTMFVCTFHNGIPLVKSVKLIIHKTPTFTNIRPNMGPLSGGTALTLTGSYLNISGLSIKLADIECPTIVRNATAVLCLTPPGGAVLNTPLRITITWNGGARIHDTRQTFTYKPDPIITKLEPTDTILSGGTRVTVTGDRFNIVGEASLQVTVLYQAVAVDVFQSVLRHRRQVNGNLTARVIINNDEIDFHVGVLLDGVPTYRNLTETLPQYAQLTVYTDPEINRWTELKVVTSDNRTLQVKGRRLLVGIQSTDYRMLIGQSECSTLDVYTNIIICTAPKDTPTPHHMDSAQGLLSVRVHIGVFKEPFLVGTLHYKLSFFDDPVTKWGIIGAAVVVCLTLLIVTVICLIKKFRKT